MHIVSSIGDPESRSTWSGTPASLITALREKATIGAVRTLQPGRGLALLGKATNVARGLGGRQASRVGLAHEALRRMATTTCADLDGAVLHFGSGHLPLITRRPNSRHYLFLDYTVALLVRNEIFRAMTNARYRSSIFAIERNMVHWLNGIFVTSDYVRASLVSDHGVSEDRIIVTGTGVGQRDWAPRPKSAGSPRLVFVAKFNFINKGGVLLLDSFDILRRTHTDVGLIIIGNQNDPEQRPLLKRMRNTPGIDFRNYDTPDYPALLGSADIYAGPAIDEPWGIVYLEAQLCETPVLMLDRNAARQFTDGGRTGFLVPHATPGAVARALAAALDDPEALRRKGRQGHMFVRDSFTWPRAAALIAQGLAQQRSAV